jgi:Amt family ammonium transporter
VVTYAIMFVINLIPGCHFRATEEAEIVGMDEIELGEYVADYAYHERDLEGNYEPISALPTRAPTPTRGPMVSSSKKSSPQSTPEVRMSTRSASDYENTHTLSTTDNGDGSRNRSRSRGRNVRLSGPLGDEVEMTDIDMAALRRAEAKIAAQQEELARMQEMHKDR